MAQTVSPAIDECASSRQPVLFVRAQQRRLGTSALVTALLLVAVVAAPVALSIGLGAWLGHCPPQDVYRSGVGAMISLAGLVYAITFALHVLRRMPQDLFALRGRTTLDTAQLRALNSALETPLAPSRKLLVLVAGTLVWALINMELFTVLAAAPASTAHPMLAPVHLWTYPFYLLWWCTIFYIFEIAARVANQLAYVGRHHTIVDLLDVEKLEPFAAIGVRLSLLGFCGLALVPLQAVLTRGIRLVDWLPTTLAVAALVAYLLIRPMWGVHVAINKAKAAELARLDRDIGYSAQRNLDELSSARFQGLVRYRDMVRGVSTWPLSRSSVLRVVAYIVIPPFAWAGAALIQIAVQSIGAVALNGR